MLYYQSHRFKGRTEIVALTMKAKQGFTLLELLVVIGIIAILAGIVIVALNPARQFAQARDAQRSNDVRQVLNAIHQNRVDNQGIFTCAAGSLPSSTTAMSNAAYNICNCIVPTYIPSMPSDPSTGTGTDCTTYSSGYNVAVDGTGRVTVSAPDTEIATPDIAVTL